MTKKQPRPKDYCKKCKEGFWMKADKKFIGSYGVCQKRALEQDLGHPYKKPESPLSLCKKCMCMTKSKNGFCCKCKELKLYKGDFK